MRAFIADMHLSCIREGVNFAILFFPALAVYDFGDVDVSQMLCRGRSLKI
ncbi:MAG: hypothetical protein ACFE0I_07250 [Elainellaceae cyanobacterium]